MVEKMVTYRATVRQDGKFWLIQVPALGRATQARHLREVDAIARDLIAVVTGKSPKSISVEYQIKLPGTVKTHLRAARKLRARAAEAQAKATAEAQAAARELHRRGVPLRDIGAALGVSHQRAHQLVKPV
jgi:hypothetical protein